MVTKRLLRLLAAIDDDLRDVGGGLQPAANDRDIELLNNNVKRELGLSLPAAYQALLGKTNGLSWGGVTVYATSASSIIGFPDRTIFGFLESNLALRTSSALFQPRLIFGDDGEVLLTLDLEVNQFETVTVHLTPLEQFKTFDEMLCEMLEELL